MEDKELLARLEALEKTVSRHELWIIERQGEPPRINTGQLSDADIAALEEKAKKLRAEIGRNSD
jgi:hypothetical protein